MERASNDTEQDRHAVEEPTRRPGRASSRAVRSAARRRRARSRSVRRREQVRAQAERRRLRPQVIRNMASTIALVVGISVLVVTVLTTTVPQLQVALGVTGTPGTATVLSRERVGRGEHHSVARFVFDDVTREPIVVDTVPDVEVGESFRAALTPEGDRVLPTGRRGVVPMLGLLATAPLSMSFLPYALMYKLGIRRGRRAAAIGGVAVAAASAGMLVAGLVLV